MGGSDFMIHGKWRRTLPALDFRGLTAYGDDPHFIVTIAADGFGPRRKKIPVKILGPFDYAADMKKLAEAASQSHPLAGPPPPSSEPPA
jgi:hypothetical protein